MGSTHAPSRARTRTFSVGLGKALPLETQPQIRGKLHFADPTYLHNPPPRRRSQPSQQLDVSEVTPADVRAVSTLKRHSHLHLTDDQKRFARHSQHELNLTRSARKSLDQSETQPQRNQWGADARQPQGSCLTKITSSLILNLQVVVL